MPTAFFQCTTGFLEGQRVSPIVYQDSSVCPTMTTFNHYIDILVPITTFVVIVNVAVAICFVVIIYVAVTTNFVTNIDFVVTIDVVAVLVRTMVCGGSYLFLRVVVLFSGRIFLLLNPIRGRRGLVDTTGVLPICVFGRKY